MATRMESVKPYHSTWLAVALAFALAVGLAALTYRAGRLLSFDSYHYCELAKRFTTEWPDRFGNHWPFGYPLAGALLARCGLPAYESLVLVSCAALFLLLVTAALILERYPLRILVLAALAAAPIVSVELFGILSELPFAAALLGLVFCLANWPARPALWGAAACAVAALTLRYAGVIAFAAPLVWVAWRWRSLETAGRLDEAIAAILVSLFVAGGLLALNLAKTGYLSGADRGAAAGLLALPRGLADFGWSVPSALLAGGLRDRIGLGTATGMLTGGLVFVLLAGMCLWIWLHPRTMFSRPLALVALGYSTGMGILHCIGNCGALSDARTFLPVLFPCGLLVAECLCDRQRWLAAGCAVLVLVGTAAAARGISREIGGDVRPAVPLLRTMAQPSDVVAINDHAFAVSAYVRTRTVRVWPECWNTTGSERLLVVAAKPRNRAGDPGILDPAWSEALARSVAIGSYRYVLHEPDLIVVERLVASSGLPTHR
jgi:hypothetical protein